MGSTPSIDLQDAAIRGKLKDIKTLTDPIENGGQNMDNSSIQSFLSVIIAISTLR